MWATLPMPWRTARPALSKGGRRLRQLIGQVVQRSYEAVEQVGQPLALRIVELGEHRLHRLAATAGDGLVTRTAAVADTMTTAPSSSLWRRSASPARTSRCTARRGRRVDAQRASEIRHPPRILRGQQVERVDLAELERAGAGAVEPVANGAIAAAAQLLPRRPDAQRELQLTWIIEVDRPASGSACTILVGYKGWRIPGPLDAVDALGVLAHPSSRSTRRRHLELYTRSGLLTVLWHAPTADVSPAAVVACGGAMGGLLGPAGGLYHRLGAALAARSPDAARQLPPTERPEACCLDVAAAVQLAVGTGVERRRQYSFGGAVAVAVGVGLPEHTSPASSPSRRSRPGARAPARWPDGRCCCSTVSATRSSRCRRARSSAPWPAMVS